MYQFWKAGNELNEAFVSVNGGLIMTRKEWERATAPWWKRLFMRRH